MKIFPKRLDEPLFSTKDIVTLMVPLVIQQVFTALIGLADTIMVAQVGEEAMSGVSLVDTINLLLINVFTALGTGGTIVTAQLLGRRDKENANLSACQAVIATFAVALMIALFCIFFAGNILDWIYGTMEDAVRQSAVSYFVITAIGYPFVALLMTCSAIFRTTGNSTLPMKISIFQNVGNVAGNALFIFVFHMGAAGAALSTCIAYSVGGIVTFFKLYSPKEEVSIHGIWPLKLDWPMIKNIMSLGIPTGLENGIFQIGKVLVQSMVSLFGTAGIAAAAVANSTSSITVMPSMAIGTGLITVAGQCIGAGKPDQMRRYTVGLTGVSLLSATALSVLLVIFMDPVITAYGVEEETRALARQLMWVTLIPNFVIWAPAFTLPNALRAASDVKFTMLIAIGSMFAFRVGLGYLLSVTLDFGLVGIWYGMIADWLFRAIVYFLRFARGKWEHHKILAYTDAPEQETP